MATNFSQRWTHPIRVIAAALLPGVAAAFPASAPQLPTGGSVAAGNVSIGTPPHGTLNINQNTSQTIINWNTFSVGAGGTVNFNQPGVSSATLNRVTSSTPSSIAGTINAPGTVMLVNPNGIAITKSGVINTCRLDAGNQERRLSCGQIQLPRQRRFGAGHQPRHHQRGPMAASWHFWADESRTAASST